MLEMIMQEFKGQGEFPALLMAMRLAGTAILCSIIGFEREAKNNPAGLRTNILVGLASATFTMIAMTMIELESLSGDMVRMDPLRILDAVTSGVAFLAAGIIVFSKGEVHGVTTGASLWLSASIGLSAGLGFWILAVFATVGGFLVLSALHILAVKIGVKDE